jgi:ABC-type proline/glycine betaine transport system permease subunit
VEAFRLVPADEAALQMPLEKVGVDRALLAFAVGLALNRWQRLCAVCHPSDMAQIVDGLQQ